MLKCLIDKQMVYVTGWLLIWFHIYGYFINIHFYIICLWNLFRFSSFGPMFAKVYWTASFVFLILSASLRKHAYSNILKISPPKNESFQVKILIFFIFLLINIDCGYSLEPPRRFFFIFQFLQPLSQFMLVSCVHKTCVCVIITHFLSAFLKYSYILQPVGHF